VAAEWRTSDGRPVFPLIRDDMKLPRHMKGDLIVLRFETGWIRKSPGTGATSPAFGFVVIGENGRKLAVYHYWGDG